MLGEGDDGGDVPEMEDTSGRWAEVDDGEVEGGEGKDVGGWLEDDDIEDW